MESKATILPHLFFGVIARGNHSRGSIWAGVHTPPRQSARARVSFSTNVSGYEGIPVRMHTRTHTPSPSQTHECTLINRSLRQKGIEVREFAEFLTQNVAPFVIILRALRVVLAVVFRNRRDVSSDRVEAPFELSALRLDTSSPKNTHD
jgi:hypothetical protein